MTVQEYRSQKVFVLGEAEKPGTYPLTGRVTLLDVLSQAGGPSKTAGRQVVIVRFPRSEAPVAPVAPGTAGSTTLRVNLKKLLDGDTAENLVARDRGHGLRSQADELLRPRRGEEARRLRAGQGDLGARGDHARRRVHRTRGLHRGEGAPAERGRQPGDDRRRSRGDGFPSPRASPDRERHDPRADRQQLLRAGRGEEARRLPARAGGHGDRAASPSRAGSRTGRPPTVPRSCEPIATVDRRPSSST